MEAGRAITATLTEGKEATMLDKLISASLRNRALVLGIAAALLVAGGYELIRRPLDIFPDLNQPIVTVLAEAPGLAPEEVETLVAIPLESVLSGVPGLTKVRTSSTDGLAIVRLEFGWDTDLYRDRQLVSERLALADDDLPAGVVPEMAPIGSITGNIVDVGLVAKSDDVTQMELHTLAEWVVRRRLMSVPGVAQVVVIGGENKQYQVLADPDLLTRHNVTLGQVAQAVQTASQNTSGSYLVLGDEELLVRNLGRLRDAEEIGKVVVAGDRGRPVRVEDVAKVALGYEYPRGAASVGGVYGVLMEVFKQPGTNTLDVTAAIDSELEALRQTLPRGVELRTDLFRQATFLQRGVDNVIDALTHGAVLVIVILLLFLMNWKASAITLVSLPLSFATAGAVFYLLDLSLNTMTLGGLAIAVGELVDDAIVGVENVLKRIRQRAGQGAALHEIVKDASSEVRGPIFSGTLIVILVFLPLFALAGIEGRLFTSLAWAYVVSLLASMVVSLTVTPVLCLLLFKKDAEKFGEKARRGSPALRGLGAGVERLIAGSLKSPGLVGAISALALVATLVGGAFLGSEFLPPFDEGTVLVMSHVPPGTSLEESDRVAHELEKRLIGEDEFLSVSRFTGRGRHDEHAPPVTISHIMVNVDPASGLSRGETLDLVRRRLGETPGVSLNVGQPLAHRIDHLLSGVQAQIVVKVQGPKLEVLRETAARVAAEMKAIPGVTDLYVEPQVIVDQMHIDFDRERLEEVGLSPGELARELELAIGGRVVTDIIEGERRFGLLVRLEEESRDSARAIEQLPIPLPGGSFARLGALATIEPRGGPNAISRDNRARRIAVSCNVDGRSLGDVAGDIEETLGRMEGSLPPGYFFRLEGQFANQADATRMILWLSIASLLAIVFILYAQFRSSLLVLQVLLCLPVSFAGGAALLLATGQTFNVASLVGFVSLAGIASRNGILLLSHYLHLLRSEGEKLSHALLVRAGRERAAPVVMTALTTGAGLFPLLLSAGEAGREILYPVATVVVGGLLTSTIFEFILRPVLFWTTGKKVLKKLGLEQALEAPIASV